MKWKNAANDGLPRHSRTVLISLGGVYHVARFDIEKDIFTLEDNPGIVLPARGNAQIYWTLLPGEAAASPLRILIADDDEDDHAMMRQGLERVSVNPVITSVYDGAEAIDYLLRRNTFSHVETSPDLVLLDLNLPKHDGYSVLKTVRAEKNLSGMPIYVVSTSNSLDDWRNSVKLGANGFYKKGSSSVELLRIVRDITNNYYASE